LPQPPDRQIRVVEITDAACPWAWGSDPTFRWLRLQSPDIAEWRTVYGILFDTDDDPAPDAAAEAAHYANWMDWVSSYTHAPNPARLEWLSATSWPASQIATAARWQSQEIGSRVLRRLRETTFVDGRPADSLQRGLAALDDVVIAGLDLARLAVDAASAAAEESVRADWRFTRAPEPGAYTLDRAGPHPGTPIQAGQHVRYALPTLIISGRMGRRIVAGWHDPADYVEAFAAVEPSARFAETRLDAESALKLFGSLTRRELDLFTASTEPPRDAVYLETRNGGLWRART